VIRDGKTGFVTVKLILGIIIDLVPQFFG